MMCYVAFVHWGPKDCAPPASSFQFCTVHSTVHFFHKVFGWKRPEIRSQRKDNKIESHNIAQHMQLSWGAAKKMLAASRTAQAPDSWFLTTEVCLSEACLFHWPNKSIKDFFHFETLTTWTTWMNWLFEFQSPNMSKQNQQQTVPKSVHM